MSSASCRLRATPLVSVQNGRKMRRAQVAPSARCQAQSNSVDKSVHFMRHGTTEMNVYLGKHFESVETFTDPLLYDTRLTPEGRALAAARRTSAQALSPAPEVLLVSPLCRALDTADLAFEGVECPRVVEPLARERLYFSSDVGRAPQVLQEAYPHYDFRALDMIWWHSNASGDAEAIVPESTEVFLERMERFLDCLQERPESSIAVVAHWGVIYALTGESFENCQVKTIELSRLRVKWEEDVPA